MEKVHYVSCPLCNSPKINFALTVKDYTVSGEEFDIMECSNCSGRFTQDVPSLDLIGKYYQSSAYISHTDTRQGIVNKLYHQVRKITLGKKKSLVQQVTSLQSGKLLDVGAGTGLFVHQMMQAGWEVKGLEPDAGAREVAKKLGVELSEPSNLFSLDHASYDSITLWHVLEHVHDLHSYLEQFRKLLKTEGRLIIAVPNYTSSDAAYYQKYWAAYDVPRHLYHFSPDAMRILLAKHGFKLDKIFPQWFDSFYVSLLSEQYKTGKNKLITGAWMGFKSNINAWVNRKKCSSLIYVARMEE